MKVAPSMEIELTWQGCSLMSGSMKRPNSDMLLTEFTDGPAAGD
jgi:hypothetical protein